MKVAIKFKYYKCNTDGLICIRIDYIYSYVDINTTYEELENKCIKYCKRHRYEYLGLYEINRRL